MSADRDGAVARAVNHHINTSTNESVSESLCRQHSIHDIASEATGTILHDHITALNHAFKPLEEAVDCQEFRGIMRAKYDKGLRIKRGVCPPHATRHRNATLDTYMPLDFEHDMFLHDRLVLEKFANGNWLRDDGTYDIYVVGELDELLLRAEAVTEVPNVLAKEFSYMMLSRWKDTFVKLARIGIGMNFNKLFQHTFIDWVILHHDRPTTRDVPLLLMIADGRAKDVEPVSAAADFAEQTDIDQPIDPEEAKRLAKSNHRKVAVGLVDDVNSPAYHAILAKQMRLQQNIAIDCLQVSRAAHDRLEYAKAAIADENGVSYAPKPRAYIDATQRSEHRYEAGAHKLLSDASEWGVLMPEHQTRSIACLAYRCTVAGLCVMRTKVWAKTKKEPYRSFRQAVDSARDKTYHKFKSHVLGEEPCADDPIVESHVADYAENLDDKQSVLDMANRVLVQPRDNVLKEDNHARNRRIMLQRIYDCIVRRNDYPR